jgi:hypothetical protein
LYLILARDPLQVRRLGDQVGRVPAARGLATARAVAVNEPHERPPDAIAHRAAETASVKHLVSHDQAPFSMASVNATSIDSTQSRKAAEVFSDDQESDRAWDYSRAQNLGVNKASGSSLVFCYFGFFGFTTC